jgi:hypothetical protein
MKYFHGGIAGLNIGDVVVTADPHITDGCPICVARSEGRICTVGEYRRWLTDQGQRAVPILLKLRGVPADLPMDPPSEREAVYVTTDESYAAFYAARSGFGDLYEVCPIGALTRSETDHFPSWTVEAATVTRVLRRGVLRSRRERRELERRWKKADTKVAATWR